MVATFRASTAGSLGLSPTSAGYAYALPGGTSVTVNKAPLTITAAGNTKTYDGGITASATPTMSGQV